MNKVYINCLSSFLPNESVDNEHIEDFLGYIEGKKSRIKSIVLKRNGIKHRYYALNEEGGVTHRNSGMVVEAIKKLSSLGGWISILCVVQQRHRISWYRRMLLRFMGN